MAGSWRDPPAVFPIHGRLATNTLLVYYLRYFLNRLARASMGCPELSSEHWTKHFLSMSSPLTAMISSKPGDHLHLVPVLGLQVDVKVRLEPLHDGL